MTINRNNFEAYLLDYLEGNLDPLLTADLMAFLAENPEFEKSIPDYDTRISLSNTQSYNHKGMLIKDFTDLPEVTAGNFDEFCIAACEGLLVESDLTRLSDYIRLHPDKQRDLDLYRKITLQPDLTVRYPGKNELKKKQGSTNLRYLYYALGVAASVALLFMLVLRRPAGTVYTETAPVNSGKMKNAVQLPDVLPPHNETIQPESETSAGKFLQMPEISKNPDTAPVEETREFPAWQALAKLEPVLDMKVFTSVQPPPVTDHLAKTAVTDKNLVQKRIYTGNTFADTRIGSLFNRIDFWKTAETAISGFNYLTESNISVDRITDDSGNLTSLLIQSDSYTITGKIK
ncbi:MAG: hypothetical protein JW830_05700 [Bacteroidales bacterium]|nr:hypothetical protein [Bacteroidales bacterium]